MTLNSYFLQGSTWEQFLIQDLINEQLKIYGVEVYYLPRKIFGSDNILGEVTSSKFDDSFLIEAYVDNYEGYAPGSDIMTKFGLRLKNEVNLVISRERFEEFIVPFLGANKFVSDNVSDANYDFSITNRPREGDLIFFPLGERLFEIKRVEAEKPFYQLGKTYVYELNCELYEYENDQIDTDVDIIDSQIKDEGYITTINLSTGTGSFQYNETVTGSVSGSTGIVREFSVVDDSFNVTKKLLVANITGSFNAGETVTGSESSASYIVSSYDDNSVNDPYDFNQEIETEADGILDFTESNPFGVY